MKKRKLGKCTRCGRPAKEEFSICADGNQSRAVCEICDIALNALVLDFMRLPNAAQNIIKYIVEKTKHG